MSDKHEPGETVLMGEQNQAQFVAVKGGVRLRSISLAFLEHVQKLYAREEETTSDAECVVVGDTTAGEGQAG